MPGSVLRALPASSGARMYWAAERANGTLLFFARNLHRFFPQVCIACLLARDTDKVHSLDRKDFDGGHDAAIEDALRFVECTRTAYRIEGLKRSNIPEYPTNASRIKVVSPGSLPRGLPLTDLGGRSMRRNALRADRAPPQQLHGEGGNRYPTAPERGAGTGGVRNPNLTPTVSSTVTFLPSPEVRASADVY